MPCEIGPLGHRQRQLAQRPAHLRGLALHLLETVDGVHRHQHRVLHAPRHLAALDLFLGEIEHCLVGARLVQQLDRAANRLPELFVAEVTLLAQPDQKYPIGERPADAVQQQRGTKLSLHVAAANDFADISIRRAVNELGGQRKLAVIEDADDDARTALLLGATAFYGKFHRAPRVWYLTFLYRKGVGPAHYRQIAV